MEDKQLHYSIHALYLSLLLLSSFAFAWYGSYDYRINATPNYTIQGSETEFLATITNINMTNTSFWNTSHCENIKITNESDNNVYAYYIDSGCNSSNGTIHVLINDTYSVGNILHIYGGELDESNSNPDAIYNAGYKAHYAMRNTTLDNETSLTLRYNATVISSSFGLNATTPKIGNSTRGNATNEGTGLNTTIDLAEFISNKSTGYSILFYWFPTKLPLASGDGNHQWIISRATATAACSQYPFAVGVGGGNNYLYTVYGCNGSISNSSDTISNNTWHHFAITKDHTDNKTTMFHNGVEKASGTVQPMTSSGDIKLLISEANNNNGYGFMDDVLFANKTLSDDYISNYYNQNYTISSIETSSNITNKPVLTLLNITNTALYANSTLEANISAYDDNATSITINYTWYMNGTATGFNGSLNLTNNTYQTITLTPTGGFNQTDVWGIKATPHDGGDYGDTNGSTNNQTVANLTNITGANTTSPQYDIYLYTHELNITKTVGTLNASITIDGTTHTATKSSSGNNITFTASLAPPIVTNATNYTANWTISLLYGGTWRTYNEDYNFTVNPGGLFLCNASIGTTSLIYNFLDAELFTPVNVSLGFIATQHVGDSSKTYAINTTNETIYFCIEPYNGSVNASISETMVASGYQTKTNDNIAEIYSNASASKNTLMLLENSSNTESVGIYVKTTNYVPLPNYNVVLYQYIPGNDSFVQTHSGITDATGRTTQEILPAPKQYAVAVYDDDENLITNITSPKVSFCGSVPPLEECTYNIYIGDQPQIDYLTTKETFNENSQCTEYNGTKNITFCSDGFCTFDNSTYLLSCEFAESTTNQLFNGLNLTLRNLSLSAMDIVSSETTTGTTINLTVPDTGYFGYVFYAIYQNSSDTSSIDQMKIVETGSISIGEIKNRFGAEGWILAFLVLIGLALLASGEPSSMILLSGLSIIVVAIMGFIWLSHLTIAGIIIITLMLVYLIKRRQ